MTENKNNISNISLESSPKNEGKDDLEGAIEAGYQATSIDPKRRVGWSHLGVALLRSKRIDEAVGVLQKARDLDPDFYQSWNILGDARWRQGDKQGAITDYCSAANIEPKDYTLWEKLNKVVETERAEATAIENFTRGSEEKYGLYNLARLHLHYHKRGIEGRHMKAFDALEEAVKRHPDIAAWVAEDPTWNGYYGSPRFLYIMEEARKHSGNKTG